MTRQDTIKRLRKWILPTRPIQLKVGDCWDLHNSSIEDQVNKASNGKGKIFYMTCIDAQTTEWKDSTLSLNNHDIFITDDISNNEIQNRKNIWDKIST